MKSLEQTDKGINVAFTGGSNATFVLVVAADGFTSKTRSLILKSKFSMIAINS